VIACYCCVTDALKEYFGAEYPAAVLGATPCPAAETAAVTFAGLAPGLIGTYQVDIAIPADVTATQVTSSCLDQFLPVGLIGDSGTLLSLRPRSRTET